MILFSLALGPGLIINLIFKDHINRPRPIQLIQFGGQHHYNPPLIQGEAPLLPHNANRSFPCGHCSSGFVLFIGFFIFRQTGRKRLALLSVVTAVLLGSLIGVARMASGGHYLSDIVWSAYLTFISCWLVYLAVNRINEPFLSSTKKRVI
ncbi:MAG: phosphatase PAP2 family protein [Methylococcaceae bacterium]